MVKIFSWNVNGIRAILGKNFLEFIDEYQPDILCVQETKAHPEQVNLILKERGYNYEYWNSAQKKGYSGVAIFSKIEPINIHYGIDDLELSNSEGRVITLEFEQFFYVGVYTPNSKHDLSRLDFRYDTWDQKFLAHCKNLEKTKPVIFSGDLNAAHKSIDVRNDKANQTTATKPGNPGFTDKEREGITNIINIGFCDIFRELNPELEKFSWWSYRGGARAKNVGWRIDYFFISNSLKNNVRSTDIHDEVLGSDHCPLSLEIKF